MTYRQPARIKIYRTRIRRRRVVALLIVLVAIATILGPQLLAPSSSSSSSSTSSSTAASPPDDAPFVDDEDPAVANLDPALLGALRQAAADAAGDGVELVVNSGWRSPEHQEQLLRDAISEYGSEAEAVRWVATAETSPHVSGDAVDVGPDDARAWLSGHGAGYGLCQIYGNEPWHYELRPEAVDDGCPPMYADPTHDPRMEH